MLENNRGLSPETSPHFMACMTVLFLLDSLSFMIKSFLNKLQLLTKANNSEKTGLYDQPSVLTVMLK